MTQFHQDSVREVQDLLEKEFAEYFLACYGREPARSISATQYAKIRQAFLSGIHWMNNYPIEPAQSLVLTAALRKCLGIPENG